MSVTVPLYGYVECVLEYSSFSTQAAH